MIAEAIDTVITLGWAFLAWIVITAVAATLALYTAVVTVAFACRALWRGVAAAVALVQRPSVPVLPPKPHAPPQDRTAPSWARTEKDAA